MGTALPVSPLRGPGSADVLIRRIRRDGAEKCYFFNRADTEFKGVWRNTPVVISPGGAGFSEELAPAPDIPPIRPVHWRLTCAKNCVPLRFWDFEGGNIDLFVPRQKMTESFEKAERFTCRFFAGRDMTMELVTEEASLAAGSYFLNGQALSDWHGTDFRDCRERGTSVGKLLTDGLNTLEYRGILPENAPYLRGAFAVRSTTGFPVLKAWTMPLDTGPSVDLAVLGMPAFSGTVLCETEVETVSAGTQMFRLEELHGSARMLADGRDCGIRIASPAVWMPDLKPGRHTLVLEFCNAPGNRDVMSGERAGFSSLSAEKS